jgi:hypothetical protein
VTNGRSRLLPIPLGSGFRVDTSLAEREIGFSNRTYEAGLKQMLEDEEAYRAAGVL